MNTIVIYAGRFHPFHKGHYATYQYLTSKYGADAVYIATSGKQAPVTSPFSFADKKYMMQIVGVPADKIYETRIPYQPNEIIGTMDKESTSIIFAVSEKDSARFTFKPKKDGSPSFMQPLPDNKRELGPMSTVGYVDIAPVFEFTLLGKNVSGATEIRKMFIEADEEHRKQIIKQLYGIFDPKIYDIFVRDLTIAENTLNSIRNMKTKLTESNRQELVAFIESINELERDANQLDEMPIEVDKENPNDPLVYGEYLNPGKLSYRKKRALAQLTALTKIAEMGRWDQVVNLLPELKMNIDAVGHGIDELEKLRRKGGPRSRGITPQ